MIPKCHHVPAAISSHNAKPDTSIATDTLEVTFTSASRLKSDDWVQIKREKKIRQYYDSGGLFCPCRAFFFFLFLHTFFAAGTGWCHRGCFHNHLFMRVFHILPESANALRKELRQDTCSSHNETQVYMWGSTLTEAFSKIHYRWVANAIVRCTHVRSVKNKPGWLRSTWGVALRLQRRIFAKVMEKSKMETWKTVSSDWIIRY